MPKRPVTPPPADDEPKYLTVVHPYPLHAHMELIKDREEFGRWMACCIGPEPFHAFFYKPSALNMVIIEVRRDFDGFDRLLGEHRWDEFLKNPSEEETNKVTKVFYCVYNSGRQVQKHGWKRVDAQESWFKNWSPINNIINYPYPKTYYCDLVAEDKTNHPLCRPLPVSDFPLPQLIMQAVSHPPAPPGSASWIQEKATKPSPALKLSSKGLPTAIEIPPGPTSKSRKGRNSSKTGASPAKANNNDGSSINSPWTTASPLSSAMGSAISPNPWNRGLISPTSSSAESATSPTRSQHFSPGVINVSSSTVLATASAPAVPLDLNLVSSNPPSDPPAPLPWADNIPPGMSDSSAPLSWADDIPPGLFPDVIVRNAPSTLPPIFSSLPFSDSNDNLEDAFTDLGLTDPALGYPAKWEYTDNSQINESEADMSGSLWDNYDEEQPASEVQQLCKDHGRICKRGICKTYAKQLRELERDKKTAEREKKMAEKQGKKQGRRRGEGRNSSRGGNSNTSSWRRNSKDEVSKNNQPQKDRDRQAASVGWSDSSGASTPVNAFADEDEGGSSAATSSKQGRPRSRSVESNPGSVISLNGWGPIDSW